jgi:Zn-dependent alcohol dehydrogenase
MDVRAAIAVAAGKRLETTIVQLDGPREGEVLVEIKATGVCHTDEFTLSGADPEGLFPAILGHKGAGAVVDIGRGVTTGIGAVIYTTKVEQGAKAIVFGLGGIGLNVLQGLRLAGADMIIGVDINNDRKAWGVF